jgi:electron transport complex protein RnfA
MSKIKDYLKFKYFKPALILCIITTLISGVLILSSKFILPDLSDVLTESLHSACVSLMGEGEFELVDDWEAAGFNIPRPDSISKLIIKDDGTISFEVIASGYKPNSITALIAMNDDGSVSGVVLVTVDDSPGFREKVFDPDFLSQFVNTTDVSQFMGITGATYSSQGVADAVNTAIEVYAALETGVLAEKEETTNTGILHTLIIILIAGVLTENFLLAKFLGICPFLGVSNKLSGSLGMGLAVVLTMVSATIITYPIFIFVLVPLNITYMSTITFILIIALFVQMLEMVIRKYIPLLYETLGVFLPLMTTNCAILGVALLNVNRNYSFGYALFSALCVGLGFLLVMLIFSTIRERIEQSDVPAPFKGAPITLVAAAIMSLFLIGFNGIGG